MRRGQHPTRTTGRLTSGRSDLRPASKPNRTARGYRDNRGKLRPYQTASASAKVSIGSEAEILAGIAFLRPSISFGSPPKSIVDFAHGLDRIATGTVRGDNFARAKRQPRLTVVSADLHETAAAFAPIR
jgi:hypothetical protein